VSECTSVVGMISYWCLSPNFWFLVNECLSDIYHFHSICWLLEFPSCSYYDPCADSDETNSFLVEDVAKSAKAADAGDDIKKENSYGTKNQVSATT